MFRLLVFVLLVSFPILLFPQNRPLSYFSQMCYSEGFSSNLGMGEISVPSREELIVYPNPTNGLLQIKMPQNEKLASVTVWDMKGEVKLSSYTPNLSLNVSSLPSGIYLLAIRTIKGQVSRCRFVKY